MHTDNIINKYIWVILLIACWNLEAQVTMEWLQHYDNGFTDQPKTIDLEGVDYVYVSGTADRIFGGRKKLVTIKYDFDTGMEVWTAEFINPLDTLSDANVEAMRVVPSENAIYITGKLRNPNGYLGNLDILLIKYDLNGNLLWWKNYNGYAGTEYGDDTASDVEIDSAGNVYICGSSDQPNPVSLFGTFIVQKYSPTGTLLWTTFYLNPMPNSGTFCSDIVIAPTGEIYACGTSGGEGGLVVKMNPVNGDTIWVHRVPDVRFNVIRVDPTGDILAGGEIEFSVVDSRMYLEKLDSAGNVVWSKIYSNNQAQSEVEDLEVDSQGNVIVSGEDSWPNPAQVLVVKFDPQGQVVWSSARPGGIVFQRRRGLQVDPLGNAYVLYQNFVNGYYQTHFDKVDGNSGQVLWSEIYDGNGDGDEYPFAIKLDQTGANIFTLIWGGLVSPQSSRDFVTIRYSQTLVSLDDGISQQPDNFQLGQNYPNPFNPSTTIFYQLPRSSQVRLTVYDLLGREIMTLVNREQPAGEYSVKVNAGNLPSGIYLYRLEAGSFIQTRKMMLLK